MAVTLLRDAVFATATVDDAQNRRAMPDVPTK
jgi:hypothetical protein